MWALMVKEFREFGKYAALAAIALSAAMLWALYTGRGRGVVSEEVLGLCAAAFTGAAASLGIAQILNDTWRGKWGFVANRPVPRWKIYLAKFVAGAVMYWIATSVAILTLAIFGQNQRFTHAPFAWPMLLPAFFYQFMGLPALAAGMLVGSRRAAWLGSRFFPVALPAFVLFMMVIGVAYFVPALLVVIILGAVVFLAGMCYFVKNGQYEPQPTWIKPLQVAIIATGCAVVIGFACNIVSEVALQISGDTRKYHYSSYQIDSKGRVLRVDFGTAGVAKHFDEQGNEIPLEEANLNTDTANAYVSLMRDEDQHLPLAIAGWNRSFLRPERYLRLVGSDQQGNNWIYNGVSQTIVAIDHQGNSAGSVGPAGFRFGNQSPEPFSDPLHQSMLYGYQSELTLETDRQVFLFDAMGRSMRTVYTVPAGERIISSAVARKRIDGTTPSVDDHAFGPRRGSMRDEFAAIVTDGKLRLVTVDGTPFAPITVPVETGAQASLSIASTTDGRFVLLETRQLGDGNASSFVTDISKDGVVSPRRELAKTSRAFVTASWTELFVAPAIPAAMWVIALAIEPIDGVPTGMTIVVVGSGVAGVLLNLWICRRYEYGRTATLAWTIFAAFVGLHATLTLWCTRNRPGLVPCPSCKSPRVTTRELCEHCGQPFAKPSLPEIEVFDRAA